MNRESITAVTTAGAQRNVSALSGLLFVGLFGAGFAVANLLGSDPYPSPFKSATTILDYVADNRGPLRVLSLFYSVAAVALLVFAAYVATFVRRAAGDLRGLSELALGGGVLSATFLLLTALLQWVLGQARTADEPALDRALHDLVYLAGGPAHVAAFAPFIGASSLVALKTRALPRWVGWLGVAAAVPSLLAVTALLWEPATFILPLARTLAFAWMTAVSLLLARGQAGIPAGERAT